MCAARHRGHARADRPRQPTRGGARIGSRIAAGVDALSRYKTMMVRVVAVLNSCLTLIASIKSVDRSQVQVAGAGGLVHGPARNAM